MADHAEQDTDRFDEAAEAALSLARIAGGPNGGNRKEWWARVQTRREEFAEALRALSAPPEASEGEGRTCEGCGEPATTADVEDVPLCADCNAAAPHADTCRCSACVPPEAPEEPDAWLFECPSCGLRDGYSSQDDTLICPQCSNRLTAAEGIVMRNLGPLYLGPPRIAAALNGEAEDDLPGDCIEEMRRRFAEVGIETGFADEAATLAVAEIKRLRAELAARQQEPVAWRYRPRVAPFDHRFTDRKEEADVWLHCDLPSVEPLFAAPPPAAPPGELREAASPFAEAIADFDRQRSKAPDAERAADWRNAYDFAAHLTLGQWRRLRAALDAAPADTSALAALRSAGACLVEAGGNLVPGTDGTREEWESAVARWQDASGGIPAPPASEEVRELVDAAQVASCAMERFRYTHPRIVPVINRIDTALAALDRTGEAPR